MANNLVLPLESETLLPIQPFKTQLLKWIGNKQRFAHEIASFFPSRFNTYFEPFLGSGAVLGALRPPSAVASDCFTPLMEIWQTLQTRPEQVEQWYSQRWDAVMSGDKVEGYEKIKASYNRQPNGADLLFLCRACYGGVVRFRQADGHMSTPCGIHEPIAPASFAMRVDEWHRRTAGTNFWCLDYQEAFTMAERGDLIYCDPPYSHSQTILYGAQRFDLRELLEAIRVCKNRGVYVALSIDGTKKSLQEQLQSLLRQVRSEAGLRQVDLAIRLGRPQSFVSNYEAGERRIDFLELRQICQALGISLEEFVRRFEATVQASLPTASTQ